MNSVVGDIQCTAVWPDTKCIAGVCKCCKDKMDNACVQPIQATRDGIVCLSEAGTLFRFIFLLLLYYGMFVCAAEILQ